MIRCVYFAVLVMTASAPCCYAQETQFQEYVQALSGRWVCEMVADQDVPNYMNQGDRVRMVITFARSPDGSGLQQEWHLENGGTVRGRLHGITMWDAAAGRIKSYGSATGGFHVAGENWKEGDNWLSSSVLTHPDGRKSSSRSRTVLSDDGNTRTVTVHDRVSPDGEALEDIKQVWRRISRNHEELARHLGWVIGSWTARMETADQGVVDTVATFEWIADEQMITLNLAIGDWKGLSMIFFDPADDTIKMWGANSAGGNGQAVMRVEGDELVWTNTVFDGQGNKRVSDFAYIKGDKDTLVVRYVDQADGQTKEVVNTRK